MKNILNRATPELVFTEATPDAFLAKLGIIVIEEPDPEPYKPDALTLAKQERSRAVHAITVTVDGMELDGNEDAQRRMTAKLVGWPEGCETVQWVLADNSIGSVTKAQLQKALELAVPPRLARWRPSPSRSLPHESQSRRFRFCAHRNGAELDAKAAHDALYSIEAWPGALFEGAIKLSCGHEPGGGGASSRCLAQDPAGKAQ